MDEPLADRLKDSELKEAFLQIVVSEDLDEIPPDFDEHERFVICAVRAVAHRSDKCHLCVFVYSDAPLQDGAPFGFSGIFHMQDGHGALGNMIVLTSRGANNGACRLLSDTTITGVFSELGQLGLDKRPSLIWDGEARSATVYPQGVANDTDHVRFVVPQSDEELTQDDVCDVLDKTYNDNLKNPSGGTARLWIKGKLVSNAEDEIERHLRGQIAMYFAGMARRVGVLRQTNTSAGRTDLILIQKFVSGGPRLSGVVELKVLRGPLAEDQEATAEGLRQGYYYRQDLQMPFATLALYDVNKKPSNDITPLLAEQNSAYVSAVRVRRFAIFNSPKAWRDAGMSEVT